MYIPIMKNRTIEMSVIKELLNTGLSNKTIPLFEIIQMQSRSNSPKTYKEELFDTFEKSAHPFFLDIPKINIKSAINQSVKEFMTLVNRQPKFAIEQLVSCAEIPNLIPVISYDTKDQINVDNDNVFGDQIKKDINTLREKYHFIALRITPSQFNKIEDFSCLNFTSGDYLLLDLADKIHTNPAFKKIYRKIQSLKKDCRIKSILINSNRPQSLYNKNIVDGEPIEEIDNSLFEMYSTASYKFTGFGDYACISNALPTTGGAISPAGIYYSIEGNFFVGYKGRVPSLSEFQEHIAPSIIKSSYWQEYDDVHHVNCPGCKKIKDIINRDSKVSGKSQGVWKGITMSHYIYTIDQALNS